MRAQNNLKIRTLEASRFSAYFMLVTTYTILILWYKSGTNAFITILKKLLKHNVLIIIASRFIQIFEQFGLNCNYFRVKKERHELE